MITTNVVLHKNLAARQIAYITSLISERRQILPILERLTAACGDTVEDDPLVIFHNGAVKDGFLIEVCYPVKNPVELGEIHTRLLESASTLSMMHYGPHQTIRDTVMKINEYMHAHAWTTSLFRREIFHFLDMDHPENNITEVQVILHEWEELFASGAEEVLGSNTQQWLTAGIDSITSDSTFADYTSWIQGAIERLDSLDLSSEKKCQVVSHCAHVFPEERIEYLRDIYQHGSVDDVLQQMYIDHFWYEKPVRRGSVIYMQKNPFNPEGYNNSVTAAERRKAYCHCPFVRPYLDEIPAKLSPTFCFCGAGWYRRLWEGILQQPVTIEYLETLLRGNEQCKFTITLPFEVAGECYSPIETD